MAVATVPETIQKWPEQIICHGKEVSVFGANAKEDAVFTVRLKTESSQSYIGSIDALDKTPEGVVVYRGVKLDSEDDISILEFQLPEGSYDFFIRTESEDGKDMVLLIETDVDVRSGGVLEMSTSDATYSTTFISRGPDGEKFIYPSSSDSEEAVNAGASQSMICMRAKDGLTFLVWGGSSSYSGFDGVMRTNNPASDYLFTRIESVMADIGAVYLTMPIDFTIPENSPGLTNWMSNSSTFAETPANVRFNELFADSSIKDQSYLQAAVTDRDGYILSFYSIGTLYGHGDGSRIHSWEPENYDGSYEMLMCPVGSVTFNNETGITGAPLHRTAEGLSYCGINTAGGMFTGTAWLFGFNGDGRKYTGGNPAFNASSDNGILGNAVPTLVLLPGTNGFSSYSYMGHYGECLGIDSFRLSRFTHSTGLSLDELRSGMGGNTSAITVSYNGDIVYDNIDDFKGGRWEESGYYEAVISTDNVLIDNSMSGNSSATIKWEAGKGFGIPPTLTSLRFKDKEGNITDRFVESEDGMLEFTGGEFITKYNDMEYYDYLECHPVAEVMAEYAPHGSKDFEALDVREFPDEYYMPGYGYMWRASFSRIDKKAKDGWFDLKITVINQDGASTEQVLSPAFKIESMSGTSLIQEDSELIYTDGQDIVAPEYAEVFSIDGKLCGRKNLVKGIYLVRTAVKTTKLIIR